MNRTLFSLFLGMGVLSGLLSSQVYASGQTQRFVIGNESVEFTWFKDRNITISSTCVQAGVLKDCDARKAIEKANLSKLGKDTLGRNPGALLCSGQLGGTVVWSKDAKGNERTFCRFPDNSMIASGSLAYYGRKNSK